MVISALISALHLLALGIGVPGIYLRARALSGKPDLSTAFAADAAWGVAALLWLPTGLLRAFGGLEKGTAFYLANPMFHLKMALFVAILALEVWPMITLIRWRIQQGRGEEIDLRAAPLLARLSWVELGLILAIPFVAALMARGIGFGAW